MSTHEPAPAHHARLLWPLGIVTLAVLVTFGVIEFVGPARSEEAATNEDTAEVAAEPSTTQLDKEDYDRRMRRLAHYDPVAEAAEDAKNAESSEPPKPRPPRLWPVTDAPYPNVGAILPFHRIVAYYGNFYAKGMGVLGEYPEEEMLKMFQVEIDKWNAADPETPVMPAIDYIAITAQLAPGKDGKYRARMPHDQIDKALELAEKVNGIVILEVQAGFSDILTETKSFGDYLKHPKIHIALDPEFAMIRRGERPGRVVGTVSAAEVNEVITLLSDIVRENNIPPKVLVIHRYTGPMVSEAEDIAPTPEVQVLIDMDGWGPEAKKYSTYNTWIAPEPVQFTGFKLFYKNDVMREGSRLLTPEEVLKLAPAPSFIQFQ